MSLPPWLVLAGVCCLVLAASYQLTTRRFGWRVLGYWAAILACFLAAEAASEALGWDVTRLGDLRLAPDLGGAAAAIGVLWLLGV